MIDGNSILIIGGDSDRADSIEASLRPLFSDPGAVKCFWTQEKDTGIALAREKHPSIVLLSADILGAESDPQAAFRKFQPYLMKSITLIAVDSEERPEHVSYMLRGIGVQRILKSFRHDKDRHCLQDAVGRFHQQETGDMIAGPARTKARRRKSVFPERHKEVVHRPGHAAKPHSSPAGPHTGSAPNLVLAHLRSHAGKIIGHDDLLRVARANNPDAIESLTGIIYRVRPRLSSDEEVHSVGKNKGYILRRNGVPDELDALKEKKAASRNCGKKRPTRLKDLFGCLRSNPDSVMSLEKLSIALYGEVTPNTIFNIRNLVSRARKELKGGEEITTIKAQGFRYHDRSGQPVLQN